MHRGVRKAKMEIGEWEMRNEEKGKSDGARGAWHKHTFQVEFNLCKFI